MKNQPHHSALRLWAVLFESHALAMYLVAVWPWQHFAALYSAMSKRLQLVYPAMVAVEPLTLNCGLAFLLVAKLNGIKCVFL